MREGRGLVVQHQSHILETLYGQALKTGWAGSSEPASLLLRGRSGRKSYLAKVTVMSPSPLFFLALRNCGFPSSPLSPHIADGMASSSNLSSDTLCQFQRNWSLDSVPGNKTKRPKGNWESWLTNLNNAKRCNLVLYLKMVQRDTSYWPCAMNYLLYMMQTLDKYNPISLPKTSFHFHKNSRRMENMWILFTPVSLASS